MDGWVQRGRTGFRRRGIVLRGLILHRFILHRFIAHRLIALALIVFGLMVASTPAWAGGPRWYAGAAYFNPSVMGQPLVWQNGIVNYSTDPVNLSPLVNNSQADAMVAAAASLWSSVNTAAVSVQRAGNLPQEVSGDDVSNGSNGLVEPSFLLPGNADQIAVAVVYDETGAVLNTIFGPGTSDPNDCADNAVMTRVDGFSADGYITHAVMYVNGLCATDPLELPNVQYEMARGFGRILGLDWSAANDNYFEADQGVGNIDVLNGWPLMHPLEYFCLLSFKTPCMPQETTLRTDDIASLNRMYPVTAAVQSNASLPYRNKTITASATFSITGTIYFAGGQGMQGVEVQLAPTVGGTMPIADYTVSTISGASFTAMAGNPVNGSLTPQGNPVNQYGSTSQIQEGHFDLSDIPLASRFGNSVSYQLTFKPVNPLFIGLYDSVGPYVTGQVSPSGTMPVISIPNVQVGSNLEEAVVIADSANDSHTGIDGPEQSPGVVPANGQWTTRMTGYGHSAWFTFWARANREFTVEAQALDESGAPSEDKLEPVIGLWNGTDAVGSSAAVATTQPFNGDEVGLTTLSAESTATGNLRIGIADYRGDGRPDFSYRGRVLYADSVSPQRLPAGGGPIVIRGMGFNPGMTVQVNGVAAQVNSVTPNEVDAVAPPSNGATGTVLLEVMDPATLGVATIADELSYGPQSGDQLTLTSAPSSSIAENTPQTITVKATDANSSPLAAIPVSFSVTTGSAALACGTSVCTVNTDDSGLATLSFEANSTTPTTITATLASGASVATQFTAHTQSSLYAVQPNVYVAVGGSLTWNPVALLLSGGSPASGASVLWQTTSPGLTLTSPATSVTNSQGQAVATLQVGPLTAASVGVLSASIPASPSDGQATFTLTPVPVANLALSPVAGTGQRIEASQSLSPVILKVVDGAGDPVAGATVSFTETEFSWAAPCNSTGACPAPQVLGQQTVSAVSASDGTVTLNPMPNEEQPVNLVINASVGPTAVYTTTLTQYPATIE